MATLKFSNFAETTLASGISATDTSLTVASTTGPLFPSTGDFYVVITRISDGLREIVLCTARSGDVLTVTRAQETTTGLIFVTGDYVELRVTAAVLATYVGTATSSTWTGNNTFSGDNTHSGADTHTGIKDFTGATIAGGTPLVFEGATADAFETSLVITDPTADRTITVPDASITLMESVIVQVVHTQTGAVATGSTIVPYDDTIPQNTEGDEYMSLAITPTNASNKLLIESIANMASATTAIGDWTMALYQDSTADALALSVSDYIHSGLMYTIPLRHEMTAGTTSSTTFKIRIGTNNAGTNTFNGWGGVRKYGGVLASHIRITEIKV